MTLKQRFYNRVTITDGCWIWTGDTNPGGYGRIYSNGKVRQAHRISYELSIGPIPDGLQVCHSCDVPRCVRPSHLWLGTQKQNVADMLKKKRNVPLPGDKNPAAILSLEDVSEIRRLHKEELFTQQKLASKFNVCHSTIGNIVHKRTWRQF